MNKRIKTIFCILIFVLGMIVIFKDIGDLFNKKAVKEVNVGAAYEILTVTHTLYGLIPIGKDHYYLALSDRDGQLYGYVVRGSEKWYRKNFRDNFLTVSEDGVQIKGIAKELKTKYTRSIHTKVQEFKDTFEGTDVSIQMSLQPDQFLDAGYIWRATLKLITLFMIIVDVAAGVVVVRLFNRRESLVFKAYAIVVCLTVFLFIATIITSF